ncbi:glycosyltransferase [Nitrosospira sp. Nsp13]|uniref:glycosyltransferase family 2 protein n=1 Tax=Nitrosospira sp. Nsp13 TaxID=1855332 RepID=UPI00089270A0|nr:glycosyltransferase [Nitrosospira sp. Nsp13]SCY60147.1 Glycosyl transferase family 2 [Nitrosospira sp. Nsp13]
MQFSPGPPLVSVILPSFNHAAFVGEAVQSVLDQTFRDLELIVVDDASSDETADVVASIHDPRLTLIRLSENRAVHARNLALSQARGQYVAFQNSDDIWVPAKLAAQLEAMESASRHIACFTAVEIIDKNGRTARDTWANGIFTTVNRPAANWLQHFFDVGNCLPLPSAIAHRSDVIRLGAFRPSFVQLGDVDLWIRLAALGEFFILPEPLTKIRIMEGVNLSTPSLRGHRQAQIEFAAVLERYTESPIIEQLDHIFPDLAKTPASGAKKVSLALRAWGCNDANGAYSLFADRTVARVMEDAHERADAIAAHGTEFIHTFFARRCESEFIRHSTRKRHSTGILARCRSILGW